MVALIALSACAMAQTPPLVDIAGTTDPAYSYPVANNDAGQVVGVRNGNPFLWDSMNGLIDLGMWPGSQFSTPRSINQSGQIFGTADAFQSWVRKNGLLLEPVTARRRSGASRQV
jgi:hypothetical protein